MGVQGLWQVLQSTGVPIALESLENKRLAVDVSIWLNQAAKGTYDVHGETLRNAHLHVLFHRICKLLFYHVQPVFVFDGPAPIIKKSCLEQRLRQKTSLEDKANSARRTLLKCYLKRLALATTSGSGSAISEKREQSESTAFQCEDEVEKSLECLGSEEEDDVALDDSVFNYLNQYESEQDINVDSTHFQGLSCETQHEILVNLLETEKAKKTRNIGDLPRNAQDFSAYQQTRLLKRGTLQANLKKVRHDMQIEQAHHLMENWTSVGYDKVKMDVVARRVMSQNDSLIVLIKDRDQETRDAREFGLLRSSETNSKLASVEEPCTSTSTSSLAVPWQELNYVIPQRHQQSIETMMSSQHSISEEDNFISLSDGDEDWPEMDSEELKPESIVELGRKLCLITNNSNMHGDRSAVTLQDVVAKPLDIDAVTLQDVVAKPLDIDAVTLQDVVATPLDVDAATLQDVVATPNDIAILSHKISALSSSSCSDEMDDYIDVPELEDSNICCSAFNIDPVKPAITFHKTVDPVLFTNLDDGASSSSSSEHNDSVATTCETRTRLFRASELTEFAVSASKDAKSLASDLERSIEIAKDGQSRIAAQSMTVSQQMCEDAKDLLRLFGIPFVQAPGEAEAQCAKLEQLGLVDGVITTDSDVWLFGATQVYRHVFEVRRYAEHYCAEKVRRALGLDRQKMINLALLCGSDYTEGVSGFGPVSAMEVLAEFPGVGLEPLLRLRDCWQSARQKSPAAAADGLRRKLRHVELAHDFPNKKVFDAYMSPLVNESRVAMSWAHPQVELLRSFSAAKMGWTNSRFERAVLPLIRRIAERHSQPKITNFFGSQGELLGGGGGSKTEKLTASPSKRLECAAQRLKMQDQSISLDAAPSRPSPKVCVGKKRRATKIENAPLHRCGKNVTKLTRCALRKRARGRATPCLSVQREPQLSESSDFDSDSSVERFMRTVDTTQFH